MTTGRLLRVSAATAAMALTLLSAPAHASDGISIGHTEVADDGTVSVVLDVDPLAGGATPDLSSIAVKVDGHPVEATAEKIANGQVSRTTVLTLDTSESMAGARIREAKAAAKAFLSAAPPDVRVGLLTFSDKVGDAIAPTTDRAAVSAAIDKIRLTRGTRVYDAVVHAVNLAGDQGSRNVLLLTDGRDTGGGSTLRDAATAAHDDEAPVNVVALDQSPADRALLAKISHSSGGEVIKTADPASLQSVFTAQADALASQLLVQFPRPASGPKDVNLDISLADGASTYTDSAYVSLEQVGAGGPTVVRPGRALISHGLMLAGAAGLGLGLAAILAVILLGQRGQTESQKRVSAYLGETSPSVSPAGLKDSAVAFTATLVKGDFETRLSQRLAGAGISFTAAEWILLHAGIAVAAGVLGLVLGGPALMVVALLAGGLLPALFLKLKHSRRLAAFAAQLPETLTLISGSLGAGLSMPQAVDTVVREGHEPMAGELRRALVEHRLGIGIEDALDGVAERMESEDFRWVVMAIRIQHEVGGNLAEILNTVSDTLREREYVRRQVRTLSAEGRLSAWILGIMPPAMFVYLLFGNPTFVRPLYTEVIGWMMLGAAVVLLAAGAFIMSRLVKVEV